MSYYEDDLHRRPGMAGSGIEQEFAEREAQERRAEAWRNEVADRVEGYRVRRSKKTLAGDYSMKLDFEPRVPARGSALAVEYFPPEAQPQQHSQPAPAGRTESAPPRTERFEQPLPLAERYEPPAPVMQPANPALWPAWMNPKYVPSFSPAEPKVLEFPRSLLFPEMQDPPPPDPFELAEPILQVPRILDVPETVAVEAPPLADVALGALGEEEEDDVVQEAGFDLPLQVASLIRRGLAAVVDGVVVTAYLALFALMILRGIHGLELSKPMLAAGLAIPVLLWSAYQYLFLVYGTQTPGMKLAGLRVSSFEGRSAGCGRRRWRALMLVLSFISLGFGFWWALFDEDRLCWHDRLTHTYLTTAR